MKDSKIISQKLRNYLHASNVVVLCIGSDRITGDCLGPVVGQLLKGGHNIPAFVYGSLASPVTALNLKSIVALIQKRHPAHKVIAVDSCVGSSSDIGQIKVFRGGILPGSADGKILPEVGDVSITATTSDQAPSSAAFASVRLGFVYELAEIIANGINKYVQEQRTNKLNLYCNNCNYF